MNDQMKSWNECFHSSARNLLRYLVIGLTLVICYRAGELRLFDDKTICNTIYVSPYHQVEPLPVQEVPFGGVQ